MYLAVYSEVIGKSFFLFMFLLCFYFSSYLLNNVHFLLVAHFMAVGFDIDEDKDRKFLVGHEKAGI